MFSKKRTTKKGWTFTASDRKVMTNLKADSDEEDPLKVKINAAGIEEFDYSFDEDDHHGIGSSARKIEPLSDPDLMEWFKVRKTRTLESDGIGLGFVESKMKEILDGRPIRPVTLPKKITDKVELTPIGLEWFPPLDLKKPLYIQMRDKDGLPFLAKRIVGYREIFKKNQRIDLFEYEAETNFQNVYQEMKKQLFRENAASVRRNVELNLEVDNIFNEDSDCDCELIGCENNCDFCAIDIDDIIISSDMNSESCLFREEIPVGGGKPDKKELSGLAGKVEQPDKKMLTKLASKVEQPRLVEKPEKKLLTRLASKVHRHHHPHRHHHHEKASTHAADKNKLKKRKATKADIEQGKMMLQSELLEKDEEWFKLSESDAEQIELKDVTDTLGKEKHDWMLKNVSYESQMLVREMRSFDWFLLLTGRQAFEPVLPQRTAKHRHISFVVKSMIKLIPFIFTSLTLWFITANLLISLFVVYSQNTADLTPYEQLEYEELYKYLNGFVIVVTQNIVVSVWSATVIYRDGQFISQYLTCQSQALTDMETSGTKEVKKFIRCNHIIMLIYTLFMASLYFMDFKDSPRKGLVELTEHTEFVRGLSGVVGLMIARSYYPLLATTWFYKWVRLFGLLVQIYTFWCFRSLMATLQINAKILYQAARTWNFKFGLHFSQFSLMGRGHLYRMKLSASHIRIFKHHRYLYCLTRLYSNAFNTPVLLYFLLQTSVALLVFVTMFFFKEPVDKSDASVLNSDSNTTEASITTTSVYYEIPGKHGDKAITIIKKRGTNFDFLAVSVLVLVQSLGDFIFTTASIASAGNAIMDGFEFVRRQGQIVCASSHERRLIQSLQWSFSQTNPALVHTMFDISPPTIYASLSAILMLYSLIIQIQSGASSNELRIIPCQVNSTEECALILPNRGPATTTTTTKATTTTSKPKVALNQTRPDTLKFYWVLEDCFYDKMDKNTTTKNVTVSNKFDRPDHIITSCSAFAKPGDLDKYPHKAISFTDMSHIESRWDAGCSKIPVLKDSMDISCNKTAWKFHLEHFWLPCFSDMLMKYVLLQYVLICPEYNCYFYPIRTLTFGRDCMENPYPILWTVGETVHPKGIGKPAYLPSGHTNWTDYWMCDRKTKIHSEKERDDCGWIPLPGLEFDMPTLVYLKFTFRRNPDVYLESNPVSKHDMDIYKKRIGDDSNPLLKLRHVEYTVIRKCFNHNLFRCLNPEVNKFCMLAKNGTEAGPHGTTQGYMYGHHCYNTSLMFSYTKEPDEFQQHCSVGIHTVDLSYNETDPLLNTTGLRGKIYYPKSEYDKAISNWQRKKYTYIMNDTCTKSKSCPLHVYAVDDVPCLARYVLRNDMEGFFEAMDFRMPCWHRLGGDPYLITVPFIRFRDSTGFLHTQEVPGFKHGKGSGCWENPYENLNDTYARGLNGYYTDCWATNISKDECGSINQPFFAGLEHRLYPPGPGYPKRKWEQQINVTIDVNSRKLGSRTCVPSGGRTTIVRICYNNRFALDRCRDETIVCEQDAAQCR